MNALAALMTSTALAATPCPDLDGNGIVGVPDLLVLLSHWGPCECPADLTGDGEVGVADLLAMLQFFGQTCGAKATQPLGMFLTGQQPVNVRVPIPDITSNDFSVVGWFRKNQDDTTIDYLFGIRADDETPILRIRNVNGNTSTAVRVGNASGTNISEVSVEAWTLGVMTWQQLTRTARLHIVNEHGSGTSSLHHDADLPPSAFFDVFSASTAATGNWNGDIGCWAIHPGKLFELADAHAMYNDRRAMIPLLYDDGIHLDGLIAGTYSILQNPSGSGVTPINGARIGSVVKNGNYIVSHSGSIYTARPVAVTGAPVYALDESGFFTPDIAPVNGGMVGTSATMLRWAENAPIGLEHLSIHGNSRVARQTKHPAAAGQSHWPFAYSGTIHTGLVYHNVSKLAGVGGHRIDLSNRSRFAAFDYDTAPWKDGEAGPAPVAHDARRLWIGSVSAGAPSRPIILRDDGEISVKFRAVPGSLISNEVPMMYRMTYARGPAFSDMSYQAVHAPSQGTRGDFVGPPGQTNDADTTIFSHTYTTQTDAYDSEKRVLSLHNPIGVPEVNWLITIANGSGSASIAQIESIAPNGEHLELTLRHPFTTPPIDGNLLALGPWSYGEIIVECPPSEQTFRGLWLSHPGPVPENELGAILLSPDIWREGVDGWKWNAFGWGGNGFKPQMAETFAGVPAAMIEHLGITTALLHDGYQHSTIRVDFPHFAALLEEGGAEVVYLVGQANTVAASQEATYASFVLEQAERAGCIVTDSPLIQSEIGQLNYSGKQNSAHPSVETWLKVAAALAELIYNSRR